jgi:predicted lipoprotein with Yx(FWY)xxD motif
MPAVVGVAAVIGIATADASNTRTVVRSVNSHVGRIIVVGSNRHTLYGFTRDHRGKSACYGRCTKVWVPLWAKGKVVAAAHSQVNGRKLGRIRRRNGSYQVTYYSQPLYLYTGDKRPGQTNGHYLYQFGGSWYAIDVNGTQAPPPCYSRRQGGRSGLRTGPASAGRPGGTLPCSP